jgi:hypothetical protein
MEISEIKFNYWIKTVLWVGFAMLLVFLLSQKMVIGNQVVYDWRPEQQNRFIKGPYPYGRIGFDNESMTIIGEPVYFDVYSPRHFRQARVRLDLVAEIDRPVKLGLAIKGEDWSYDFPNMVEDGNVVTFDLSKAKYINNRLQFIISAAGVTPAEKLTINSLHVELIK